MGHAADSHYLLDAYDPSQAMQIPPPLNSATPGILGQQFFSGDGPPSAQVPVNGAGTYWDNTNKIQYQWDNDAKAWIQ